MSMYVCIQTYNDMYISIYIQKILVPHRLSHVIFQGSEFK